MLVDRIISRIYNSGIEEVILIGDRTTLLDYGHQFMGSLYIRHRRSWTRASSRCYLHEVLECS